MIIRKVFIIAMSSNTQIYNLSIEVPQMKQRKAPKKL